MGCDQLREERIRQVEPPAMSVETLTNDRYPAPSPRRRTALWVLVGLFGLSVASLVYALSSETMRPRLRLLTVSFLYLMGVSQAGIVFCAITRLVRAQWAKPYYRLAELSTWPSSLALGGFLLIYVYARDELFYWLANHLLTNGAEQHASPWLSSQWLLIRNLFGLFLFYGLSALYVEPKPDLPAARAGEDDPRTTERQLYLLSPWVLVGFVICNTFFAWDFGMMLIPHWHSTVFPIYFWFGNVFAGTAALIVFPALLWSHRAFRARSDSQPRHAAHRICADVAVLLLGAVLRDLVRQPAARVGAVWRQMYGHYAPYYWSMMAGCFFVPFAAFIFAIVKRSLPAMCLIGVAINIGIWFNKYLMVCPRCRPTIGRSTVARRHPLARPAAGFVAAVVLLARRIPAFSRWEMDLPPEATR